MKSPKFSRIIENQLIIAQQKQSHIKKLDAIYQKNPLSSMTLNSQYLKKRVNRDQIKVNKQKITENMNHHLNIRKLIQKLNSPKTYQDRLKDPYDFLIYPSLFFRSKNPPIKRKIKSNNQNNKYITKEDAKNLKKIQKNTKKDNVHNQYYDDQISSSKKLKSNKKNAQKSHSVNSQLPHNGLTLEKVKQQLPYLQSFEQKDVQEFADHLTRMIFKYNLNSMNDIEFLFNCVQQYLPEYYPQDFINTIEDMFKEIVNSLNITD